MAKRSKTTYRKMEREKARQERQRDKAARRLQSKALKARLPRTAEEDPDIAGIRPGPQPLPDPWNRPEED